MSSPKMTRMFGLRPDGAAGAGVGAAGAAFWACANALEVSVAAATNVDVPSNMFRRLRARSSAFFEGASNCSWLLASLLIALSHSSDERRKSLWGWVFDHAPKSDVAGGSIDGFSMTRRRTITTAVIRRAQMRTAFDHPARNFDIGLAGVVAALFPSAARIFRNAAGFWRVGI